ncbi:hypothetical protein BO71DRAFT_348716 [Aspergillus ellipticus CBS 707.79]|uniref:AB hydrolase-1 domain-containing protein n=1 Tax=Aspergillus ellipticus CBS 707.79 TaxID=1448320 RepID=A0A319DGW8_9EURO|nr:hypothetical protein BO71DRAFT_348716 [Aspergillus ellipticus CBS 707.79]
MSAEHPLSKSLDIYDGVKQRPFGSNTAGTQTRKRLFDSTSSLSLPLLRQPEDTIKRALLLIYIHGFNGSEASFYNFPAHVHSLLTSILSETHVVYTRIYPRYKSRGELKIARDNFSDWLSPHESDDLDVILCGHSLGGILAAEVALLPGPCSSPTDRRKHRILGLVNFDVPFLGLHPRIIQTSIGGLFQKKQPVPKAEPDEEQASPETNADFFPENNDPYYDPPFSNDVHLIERGRIHGIIHFFEKNINNLSQSILERLVSPYKFAGCLNNYLELRRRYRCLEALEATDDHWSRVRFVNYYTASTGYPALQSETLEEEPPDINKVHSNEGEFQSSLTAPELLQIPGLHHTNTADKPCPDKQDPQEPKAEYLGLSCSNDSGNGQTGAFADDCPEKTLDQNVEEERHKYRKFCFLPSHHLNKRGDPLWKPIKMEDMDEVAAHQCMFLPHAANYDQLVGDTVAEVERWIQDDLTQRVLSTFE